MKQLTLLCAFVLFLFSCKQDVKDDELKIATENQEIIPTFDLDTLRGMYIGDFAGSDIRIVISFVSHNHAVGYNIHKGLQRNISGTLKEEMHEVILELNEPGDHEFDGVFTLTFAKEDLSCTGTWKSNSNKIKSKSFNLKRVVLQKEYYELDKVKLEDISNSNFCQIFAMTSDTIGDLNFFEDGLCKFEYYPKLDEVDRKEQLKVILGSWTISDDHRLIVSWKKNDYFEDAKSIFDIVLLPESYEFYLNLNGRKFRANNYAY